MPHSDWSEETRKIVTITQVVSASISLCASLTMAVLIARPKNGGLKTPYRRIIFGLSVSDIFQSFALASGPWSIPSWINVSWAHGNETSCQANGVLLTFGQCASPMYICAICLYHLSKLKYRMTNVDFKHKIEWKVHTFIVLYNFIVAGSASFLRIYNTGTTWSFCHFATTPLGCRNFPETNGECDTTTTARVDIYIILNIYALILFSLIGITVMMVMLYKHVNFMEMISGGGNSSQRNQTQTQITNNSKGEGEGEGKLRNVQLANEEVNTTQMEQIDNISKICGREIKLQATCYVGVFIVTYLPLIFCFSITLMKSSYELNHIILNRVPLSIAALFFPIGGVFNMLVYVRTGVVVLQMNYPEFSKLKCLWLVLRTGGEIPNEENESVPNEYCPSLSCQKIFSASRRFPRNETTIGDKHQSPLYGGRQLGNNDDNLPMPKVSTTGNMNSEPSRSKVEGESGFVPEQDWSYEEGGFDINEIYAKIGDSNGLKLSSGTSFLQGE